MTNALLVVAMFLAWVNR